MKRGATKDDIIRTTCELITRNGIRAVRVDEIAQVLGISKRTLYEMFSDKTDLINACLDDMNVQIRRRIEVNRRRPGTSLQKAFRLAYEYSDTLYLVDHSFLKEVRQKISFSEHYEEHRMFWRAELCRAFDRCRQDGYLLAEVDSEQFADRILNTLFELRLTDISCEELKFFCRTMIRGIATRTGIEYIDNRG